MSNRRTKEEIRVKIAVLRLEADALSRPEVAETVRRFNGKIVNKRFHDALAAAVGVRAWYRPNEYSAGGSFNLSLREAVPAELRSAANYDNACPAIGDGAFLRGERLNADACLSSFREIADNCRRHADEIEADLARWPEAFEELRRIADACRAFCEKYGDDIRYTFRDWAEVNALASSAKYNAIA